MDQTCPKCDSKHIDKKNYGTKGFAAVGGAASTTALLAGGTAAGAEVGAAVGIVGGPVGIAIGTVAGGVIGAISAFAVGAGAGAIAGKAVDTYILDNLKCLDCGHKFSE